MKRFTKFFKLIVIGGLLCAFVGSMSFAGNEPYQAYNLMNTGYTWNNTGSYNTKATTGANWFMQAPALTFDGVSTAGTYGMGFAPCNSGAQHGLIHWATVPSNTWYYTGWWNSN